VQNISPNPRKAILSDQADAHWSASKLGVLNSSRKSTVGTKISLKVLIVERDSMSSDLLAGALAQDGRCKAVAIQGANLLQALETRGVDLVVIGAEFNWHGRSGFDLARSVSVAHSETSIAILLDQPTRESVIAAFRSGARGVFSRQQPMTELLDCVEQVGKGCIWAGKQETALLLEAFRSIPAPALVTSIDSPALTTRELEVARCAAKGKTNKAIAMELGLSEHTVKNYLFRAFEKLGVSSRVELLFYLTTRGHTFSGSRSNGSDNV